MGPRGAGGHMGGLGGDGGLAQGWGIGARGARETPGTREVRMSQKGGREKA